MRFIRNYLLVLTLAGTFLMNPNGIMVLTPVLAQSTESLRYDSQAERLEYIDRSMRQSAEFAIPEIQKAYLGIFENIKVGDPQQMWRQWSALIDQAYNQQTPSDAGKKLDQKIFLDNLSRLTFELIGISVNLEARRGRPPLATLRTELGFDKEKSKSGASALDGYFQAEVLEQALRGGRWYQGRMLPVFATEKEWNAHAKHRFEYRQVFQGINAILAWSGKSLELEVFQNRMVAAFFYDPNRHQSGTGESLAKFMSAWKLSISPGAFHRLLRGGEKLGLEYASVAKGRLTAPSLRVDMLSKSSPVTLAQFNEGVAEALANFAQWLVNLELDRQTRPRTYPAKDPSYNAKGVFVNDSNVVFERLIFKIELAMNAFRESFGLTTPSQPIGFKIFNHPNWDRLFSALEIIFKNKNSLILETSHHNELSRVVFDSLAPWLHRGGTPELKARLDRLTSLALDHSSYSVKSDALEFFFQHGSDPSPGLRNRIRMLLQTDPNRKSGEFVFDAANTLQLLVRTIEQTKSRGEKWDRMSYDTLSDWAEALVYTNLIEKQLMGIQLALAANIRTPSLLRRVSQLDSKQFMKYYNFDLGLALQKLGGPNVEPHTGSVSDPKDSSSMSSENICEVLRR